MHENWSRGTIAETLGVHPPTVAEWLAKVGAGQGVTEAKRGWPVGNGHRLTPT